MNSEKSATMTLDGDVAKIKEFISYDPDTGVCVWKKSPARRVKIGDEIGCTDRRGYRNATFCGKLYLTHRIAFAIMTGRWPREVDHINGRRSDNRWDNLREVTRLENNRNSRKRVDNSTGVSGVTLDKRSGKFVANIRDGSTKKFLGSFDSLDGARQARKIAEKRLGYHKNHGRAAE